MSRSYPSLVDLASGCIVAAFACGLTYLLLRNLFFPVILPMLLAYAIASWIQRVVSHTGMGQNKRGQMWGSMLLAVILCVAVLCCGIGIVSALAKQAQELVEIASTQVAWDWITLPDWLPSWLLDHVSGDWQNAWRGRIDTAVTALIEKGATWLGSLAGAVLSSLPGATLTVFFTIASLFYWLADRDGITAWLSAMVRPLVQKLPAAWQNGWSRCRQIWQTTGVHAVAYLRAQLSLSAVVFVVLSVGFGLCAIEGYMAWAALVTLTDLLPLVGSGVILVPWGTLMLLTGQTGRGIGLLILWGLTWLLRQILEPKLTGHALGVHPYIMLMGMYTGYRIGGIGGMLCAAVVVGLWGRKP